MMNRNNFQEIFTATESTF